MKLEVGKIYHLSETDDCFECILRILEINDNIVKFTYIKTPERQKNLPLKTVHIWNIKDFPVRLYKVKDISSELSSVLYGF
jgi:hypothetical protein